MKPIEVMASEFTKSSGMSTNCHSLVSVSTPTPPPITKQIYHLSVYDYGKFGERRGVARVKGKAQGSEPDNTRKVDGLKEHAKEFADIPECQRRGAPVDDVALLSIQLHTLPVRLPPLARQRI
jgi:hypothetical protein